jgi:hypothetical protein
MKLLFIENIKLMKLKDKEINKNIGINENNEKIKIMKYYTLLTSIKMVYIGSLKLTRLVLLMPSIIISRNIVYFSLSLNRHLYSNCQVIYFGLIR